MAFCQIQNSVALQIQHSARRRPAMKALWKPLLVAALLLGFMPYPAAAYLEKGTIAPDFEATGLDGKDVHLSDFKGKVIILKLGTTWCPDCVGMTKDLLAAGEYLKENDVVVVDVFIQETAKTVSSYLKGKDFLMPFFPLLDKGKAHRAYQVYLIPRLVIIDQDFKIVHDGLRLAPKDLKEKTASLVRPETTDKIMQKPENTAPCP
jgi:thiol-disulfide isomerase/thioredoxin